MSMTYSRALSHVGTSSSYVPQTPSIRSTRQLRIATPCTRAQHVSQETCEDTSVAPFAVSFASQAAAFSLIAAAAWPAACMAEDAVEPAAALSSLTDTVLAVAADTSDAAASAAAAVPAPPLTLAEISVLAAPVVLYTVFNAYRSNVNGKAKWSDFLLIIAAVAIVGNIGSIAVLHKRLF